MPRVRWAVRCRAHRPDGEPCQAWAIRGGYVCKVHGGSLWRTRQAAVTRLTEKVMRRAFATAHAKWQRQLVAFHAQRILVAAELMDLPIEQVTEADIWECRLLHGVPAPSWEAPKIRDVPLDRRYLPFLRSDSAVPRRREAAREHERGRWVVIRDDVGPALLPGGGIALPVECQEVSERHPRPSPSNQDGVKSVNRPQVTGADLAEAARTLRTLVEVVERGELDASASMVAYLSGAAEVAEWVTSARRP